MSVNLSPLGGAGAQFFTNDGVPLTGGLLYTYLAGTSTPATTYSSSTGITALANPIILDAAGRVPTGEIWLSDGISYKFVLKDSTDVLIATWDNLSGINSNFIAYTAVEETATATAGQTVFNLTLNYIPASNNLAVFVNGSNQIVGVNYTETDDNTVTFLTGLNVGDVVKFSTATPVATNATSAANVSYTPAGVGAVTTNVQAKFRQTVSVQDFGATGDGVTNDTAAIVAAIAAVTPTLPGNPWDLTGSVAGGTVYLPEGKYLVSPDQIEIPAWVNFKGAGKSATLLFCASAGTTVVSMGKAGLLPANDPLQSYHCSISGLTIYGNSLNVTGLSIFASFWMMFDVEVTRCNYNGIYTYSSYTGKAYNTYSFYNATSAGYAGILCDGAGIGTGTNDVTFFGGSIGNCYDGIRINNGNGNCFDGLSIQSSARIGINVQGNASGTTITNCYFEANVLTVAGASIYGSFNFTTIENNYFTSTGSVLETKYIAGTDFNGVKIVNNTFGDLTPTAYIGLVNEAAVSCTFIRNLILGNSGADDSIPLFTPALKVFVDAALYSAGSNYLNRVDHLAQYFMQVSAFNTYTATLVPATSGTITLDSATNTCTFTKIGRLVTVQGAIQVASVSSPVGTFVKLSIPYVVAGLNSATGQFGGAVASSSIVYAMDADVATSFVRIWVDASTIATNKLFRFSFSYVTT